MNKNMLDEAILRYSKALERRLKAKTSLHLASKEDEESRYELTASKHALTNMEHELNAGIFTKTLIPSTVVLKTIKESKS